MTTLSLEPDYTHRVTCSRCGHNAVHDNIHDAVEDYRRHDYLTCPASAR